VKEMVSFSFNTVMDIPKYGLEIVLRQGLDISMVCYDRKILKMIRLSMMVGDVVENVREKLRKSSGWFEAVVYTGAKININAIASDPDHPGARIEGDEVVFEKPITDFAPPTDFPQWFHWAGLPSGDELKIVFRISSDGIISVSAKSKDIETALLELLMGGVNNYWDRSANKPLPPNMYGGDPKDFYTSDDIVRMNGLSGKAARIYFELLDKGYASLGPKNLPELYARRWKLYNHTGKKITIVRSFIYHQQFDFGWYDHKCWGPVERARNRRWSPINSNPD